MRIRTIVGRSRAGAVASVAVGGGAGGAAVDRPEKNGGAPAQENL